MNDIIRAAADKSPHVVDNMSVLYEALEHNVYPAIEDEVGCDIDNIPDKYLSYLRIYVADYISDNYKTDAHGYIL